MKSQIELWRRVAEELATWCHTSVTDDYKKLVSRVEQEGFSYLTITLPAFAKDFERCLEQGAVDPYAFPGFKRKRGLPLFLGGFLGNVFDASSGTLVDDCESSDLLVDSIFAVRQLCYLFAKIEVPCSDARVSRAIRGYIDCEQELHQRSGTISAEDMEAFRRISSLVFRGVFTIMDSKVYDGELLGKHGPGATADKLVGNGKFDQLEWTDRLERVFPAREHLIPNDGWAYQDQLDRVQFLEPDAERPVRVITVPKTLKTPRIIAIEPTCMQYMQQALLEPLVEVLERQTPNHRDEENLASHFLGFSDQNPNRDLAMRGSKIGDLATLDLSEASDRVLNELVIELLHNNPLFSEAVQACRSTTARVPSRNGEIILPLAKFASMGSALCFPFEAMIFLVAIFVGIEKSAQRPLTRSSIKKLRGSVRVYGDDLIVPVEHVKHVIDSLESFGFKINVNKSFWTGKFRESCGGDYYDGQDVTPVKVRRLFPKSRADVQEVISLVKLRNHMYHMGLWQTSAWLDEKIGKVLPHFPVVQATSPVLGRESLSFDYSEERVHPDTHSPLVRGYTVSSRPPPSRVSGEGALLKFFLKRGVLPFADEEHLERSGRPQSFALKLRWVQPF